MASNDNGTLTPPYVSWRTFWTFIEDLRATGSAPQVVDNYVLGANRSGAARSQLLGALRFLGLTTESKVKTEDFDELVMSDEPKQVVARLLRTRYGPLFALGLQDATAGQVDKALSEMGAAAGDSLRRTRQFFINGATEAGIDLGPHLRKVTPAKAAGVKPRRRLTRKTPTAPVVTSETNDDFHAVELNTGGRIEVRVTGVRWFSLSETDRTFIIEVVDKLKGYRKTPQQNVERPRAQTEEPTAS